MGVLAQEHRRAHHRRVIAEYTKLIGGEELDDPPSRVRLGPLSSNFKWQTLKRASAPRGRVRLALRLVTLGTQGHSRLKRAIGKPAQARAH